MAKSQDPIDITPPQENDAEEASTCHANAHEHGYIRDKAQYQRRLARIEGQVRGIERMVDEEQYCIDILTQVSAIQSALRNVARGLLDDHMRSCVVDAVKDGAFADHGEVTGEISPENYRAADEVFDRIARLGIDYAEVMTVLETQGLEKFDVSWAELQETIRTALDRS